MIWHVGVICAMESLKQGGRIRAALSVVAREGLLMSCPLNRVPNGTFQGEQQELSRRKTLAKSTKN